MDKKIRAAFDKIHAEDSLKTDTKSFIYNKANCHVKSSGAQIKRILAAACVFVLFLGIGGYFSYTIPVAAISLDINPSVELEINLYDRVISVKGYSDDGKQLAEQLNIKNMEYPDAINTVMNNNAVKSIIETNGVFEVTIAGISDEKAQKIQDCISSQTEVSSDNIYCITSREDIENAHNAGLSFGKYRAFLELAEAYPNITVEDVKSLTMKEIRDMISGETESVDNSENVNGSGYGSGNGSKYGNGYGSGNGKR